MNHLVVTTIIINIKINIMIVKTIMNNSTKEGK